MTLLAFRLKRILAGVQPPLLRQRTRSFGRMTGNSSLIGLGKSSRPNVPYDLGANVTPRPERRAGSQTHKSRRGLGESRYRGTLSDPVATTVAAAPPIQRPSSRHTPRSKKPPKIAFSVCIQKVSRKVLDLYEDSIRFPLRCLPNVQSVDLTRRRELKPEVCLKIAPSVRVECASQIQSIVLDAVD